MITLTMSNLDASIIAGNTFITLEVIASNDHSSASAIVTLGIIKDDINSPAFEKAIYSGTYDMVTGLALEQIVLVQGYDNSVEFDLEGGKTSTSNSNVWSHFGTRMYTRTKISIQ